MVAPLSRSGETAPSLVEADAKTLARLRVIRTCFGPTAQFSRDRAKLAEMAGLRGCAEG